MRRGTLVWVAALVLGCAAPIGPDDNPSELVDSAGYAFGWSCDVEGCRLGPVPFVDAVPPCWDAQWSLAWGRFFEICVVCPFEDGGWETSPNLCRPAACESDSDCPQLYPPLGDAVFECASGLCQRVDLVTYPRDALTRGEAALLCFRDVARELTMSTDDPLVIERLEALDATCPSDGDRCELPASCTAP